MKKKKRDQPNVCSEGINPVLIEEFVEKRNAAVIRDIRWMLIYGQVFYLEYLHCCNIDSLQSA